VGIDPGLSGAFCFLTDHGNGEKEIVFQPMPIIGRDLDFQGLVRIFSVIPDCRVFLERVSAMPKQGVSSMFKFGRVYGALQAMLHAFKIEHEEVSPQAWQKEMHEGISKKDIDEAKARSLVSAQRLFPGVNLLRSDKCKKPESGFVDALLIAEYGRRKSLGSKTESGNVQGL
jgi:crossover junction endodeoxyribonuclease RuvC